ncbi:MAG: hypothetical protein WCG25_04470 [bacterium]
MVLVSILDINNNITANSQGFILSDKAAGSIIPKNFNLSFRLVVSVFIPDQVSAVSSQFSPELAFIFLSK